MKINIIVAVSNNNVIGNNGVIPWYIPDDLKRFKQLTTGHVVLMGKNTWESLPVKPLYDRSNIIISSTLEIEDYDNAICHKSLSSSLLTSKIICNLVKDSECFIIGGSRLYKEALDLDIVDTIYLTRVNDDYQGDTFFPDIDWTKWKEVEREYFEGYSFLKFDKK
jgi:dihydrofolate reductase